MLVTNQEHIDAARIAYGEEPEFEVRFCLHVLLLDTNS